MENQKGKSQNTYPSALFQVATPVMAAIPVWLQFLEDVHSFHGLSQYPSFREGKALAQRNLAGYSPWGRRIRTPLSDYATAILRCQW